MSGTCSHRADSSKRCTSTTLVTTQMLTQMLLATVSLCVLSETALRSRPCSQLLHRQTWVLDGDRRCVDHRAGAVHTDYERHARRLDEAHHSHIADPAARPIFLRLTQEFPRVRGHVFGAFRECSADVHALLHETATAAAAREWRESCLLYTSPSPRDQRGSRMPSSA